MINKALLRCVRINIELNKIKLISKIAVAVVRLITGAASYDAMHYVRHLEKICF